MELAKCEKCHLLPKLRNSHFTIGDDGGDGVDDDDGGGDGDW